MAAAKKTAAKKSDAPVPFYIVADVPLEDGEFYTTLQDVERAALDSLYDDDEGYIYKVTLLRTVKVQSALVDV